MEVKIKKQIPQIETIKVELPYYYKHVITDYYGDLIIYGKIEETLCTTIDECKSGAYIKSYEIEKEKHSSIENSGLASYFEDEHKSNKEEFEAVKERCLSFLNG